MRKKPADHTWLAKHEYCEDCGGIVIMTQHPDFEPGLFDYWWYCGNKNCKNRRGVGLYDTDGPPNFVKQLKR